MVKELERPTVEEITRRGPGPTPGFVDTTVPDNYYGYPALKKPGWKWMVPAYFFTGGIAAGSYVVATLADLFGAEEDRDVSRAGRLVALVAILLSPVLLIMDLGRPERFANMLRILKARSPMNTGAWVLTGFGVFTALGVLRQAVEDSVLDRGSLAGWLLGWIPLQVTGVLGSLLAFFVSSYTGLLVSFTNVPLWARNRLLQGPLFLTSALSTGLAAISLLLALSGGTSRRVRGWTGQAETAATLGEIGFTVGSLATLGPLARPMVSSRYGAPFWLGAVGLGLVAPTMLRRRGEESPAGSRQALHAAAALSVLVGGFIFRCVEVKAGEKSAEDPAAYFAFARNRS